MNDDEWIVKRVADLEVGDDVRDYGVVSDADRTTYSATRVRIGPINGWSYWPAHARVDVRRPVEVTVTVLHGMAPPSYQVRIGYDRVVASFISSKAHAEEYAERLRGSADERRRALGQ